jgi:hypothetical protein
MPCKRGSATQEACVPGLCLGMRSSISLGEWYRQKFAIPSVKGEVVRHFIDSSQESQTAD